MNECRGVHSTYVIHIFGVKIVNVNQLPKVNLNFQAKITTPYGLCIRYETYNDDGRVMLEASAGILIVDFREGQRQIRSRLAIKTLKTLLSVSFLTLTRWSRDWQPFWLAGKGWNRLMGIWQQMKAPKGWVEFLNWMLGNSGSCGWKLQNSCMYTGK